MRYDGASNSTVLSPARMEDYMDIESLLGGVKLGKDTSGNFKLSLAGVAVRPRADAKFVAFEGDHVVEVDDVTFDGGESYIYRIPAEKVEKGDLIIRSENPFSVLFVTEVRKNGSQMEIVGLDPDNEGVIWGGPTTNVLAPNLRFFVKVVSLVDGQIGSLFGGSGDQKLNESLLPLLLLGNKGQTASDPLATLLLLKGLGENDADKKALLTLLLLKGGSDGPDPLLFLLATKGGIGDLADLFSKQPKKRRPAKAEAADEGYDVQRGEESAS